MNLENDRTWQKWVAIVREALTCLDFKTYNWVHLPEKGGYYDQDEAIITIWNVIRNKVCEAMKDESFLKSLEGKNGKSTA